MGLTKRICQWMINDLEVVISKVDNLNILDLFAGGGGLSLGFHNAGFRTGFMIDSCCHAVETLKDNFKKRQPLILNEDLGRFRPSDFKKHLLGKDMDIIIGGPPCQGWSLVGRGKLKSLGRKPQSVFDDPRNRLYKQFISYVKAFQPVVCLMENVPGMTSLTNKNMAKQVAKGIEKQGYNVTYKILNAVNYGVPQVRKRLFFIGIREDMKKKFVMPQESHGDKKHPLNTVRDAIKDLPKLESGKSKKWIMSYNANPEKQSAYSKRLRRGYKKNIIQDHVCRVHNSQDIEAFGVMKEGDWYRDLPRRYKRYRDDIFQDKYKKLKWSKPSGCVTAHLSKDCYTHIHPSQKRTISVREAARLQSFPDRFQFSGKGMSSKFRLIGNAVPPLMAEVIAKEIRKQVFS